MPPHAALHLTEVSTKVMQLYAALHAALHLTLVYIKGGLGNSLSLVDFIVCITDDRLAIAYRKQLYGSSVLVLCIAHALRCLYVRALELAP